MAGPGVGDQAGRDKWKKMEENFFSRDSGSFGARTRWGKAVAGPGVGDQAGRDKWKKMEENFFSRDSDAAFAPKSEDSRLVWGQN